jgi:CheY-like chemotaxis protein
MVWVLVAEGEPDHRAVLGRVLRDAGYGVFLRGNAVDAMAVLRTRQFALALVGEELPDGAARDVLVHIKATRVYIPVIVIARNARVPSVVESIRLGAVDYVERPIPDEDLLARVAAHALREQGAGERQNLPRTQLSMRWALAVAAVLPSPRDIRTVPQWAQLAGASMTSLRDWCRLARARTRDSLMLARCLRAMHLARADASEPAHYLDVSDPRTLQRLFSHGGLLGAGRASTLRDLLVRQRLVRDQIALEALRVALTDSGFLDVCGVSTNLNTQTSAGSCISLS